MKTQPRVDDAIHIWKKHQQAEAKDAMTASVALAGNYAQENYKEAVDAWHKSGNFAKDSGLVTEIVDKKHPPKVAHLAA